LENADSARRCRFRNSQQKRASDLARKSHKPIGKRPPFMA
jgi:hypothetical protein